MHHVQNYFCNEAADPNQEDIFVEEHKKLRKSHTTPCILEKKTCTIATQTYNNSQSTEMPIQIVTPLTQIV